MSRKLAKILRRCVLGVCLLACVAALGLWAFTLAFGSVGIFSLGNNTDLRFSHGQAEVRHRYDEGFASPVSETVWHATAVSRGWIDPPRPQGVGALVPSFSRGHVTGIAGPEQPLVVRPARFWLLYLPLWPLALVAICTAAFACVRWDREHQAGRRGFAIELPPPPPQPPTLQQQRQQA
jgi:hypothetical protein